jgi:hypothetical protein
MFPYDEGERFQQAVFLKDGQEAFAEVFRKPPTTTAQVMHPELYFSHTEATAVKLPKPAPHTRGFVEGTVGELDEEILLAPLLKGGAYRIDESKSDHRTTLIYITEWDGEAAAGQYFEAYRKVLQGKWKQCEITNSGAGRFAGHSEDGYFAVRLEGARVVSREGFAGVVE